MSIFDGNEDDWFEISDLIPSLVQPKPSKKLKLCADASVPREFIDEVRQADIPVETAFEAGLATHDDSDILVWAKRSNRVLITLDRDFWNDRKFPVQNVLGVIFVDVSPDKVNDALRAFGLVYGTFAASYPLDWWIGIKVRATTKGYVMKIHNWEGRVVQYAMKLVIGLWTNSTLVPFEL